MSTITLDTNVIELRTVRHVSAPARPAARQMRSTQGSVRLTRRGRVVVLLASLMLALVAGIFLGSGSVATEEAGTPAPTEIVMVEEGQTLWGIAAAIADDGDVREVMNEIERLNALESGMLSAGQELRIPLETHN